MKEHQEALGRLPKEYNLLTMMTKEEDQSSSSPSEEWEDLNKFDLDYWLNPEWTKVGSYGSAHLLVHDHVVVIWLYVNL